MSKPVRFALIGVDSPHAPSFIRLFGDGSNAAAVPGGTIVAAWKGESAADFPPSRDRIDDFARQVVELGVPLVDTLAEAAGAADALLIVTSDARKHAALFLELAPFGKPIYVDTRFATRRADAEAMLAAAREHGALALAGSPKRFTPEFGAALERKGAVSRIELFGSLPTQPGHPGLQWYGVHLVDLAVAALGAGFVLLSRDDETFVLHWRDGRTATLGGPAAWQELTTGVVTTAGGERSFSITANEDMLVGLLAAIVAAVRSGTPTVPYAEILDIVAAVEAGS